MNCGPCVQANIIKSSFADITVAYSHYSLSKTWNLRHFLINTAADSCITTGIYLTMLSAAHRVWRRMNG